MTTVGASGHHRLRSWAVAIVVLLSTLFGGLPPASMEWPGSQSVCADVAVTVAVNPDHTPAADLLAYRITAGHSHGPPAIINGSASNGHTYYVVAGNTPVLVHNCNLDWQRARVTEGGVDVVENHLLRFTDGGPLGAQELGMLDRLRAISTGNLAPTAHDLRFYTHELREFVLYRRAGYPAGQPPSNSYEFWDLLHTQALNDYGLTRAGAPIDLYHPSVR